LSQWATTFLMKGAEAAQRLFTGGTKPPDSMAKLRAISVAASAATTPIARAPSEELSALGEG
jgi:hypothetical protein